MKMTGDEFKTLYVKDGKILPNNVSEIKGDLYLSNNKISKIENLPNTINGNLFLSNNPVYTQFKKTNFTNVKDWAYTIMKLNIWKNL